MNSNEAQALYLRHAPSMAYVAVRNADGDEGIGTAFHVGEGVFVTARHVVEGVDLVEVKPTHELRRPLQEAIPETTEDAVTTITKTLGQEPTWPIFQNVLRVTTGPLFHRDPEIDVAVFATEGLHPETPYIPLGSHLDDWIHRRNFVLSEAVVLGYPPIPLTREPILVATRAEINAIVDLTPSSKVHFIVSATPRGGFSGGVALSEYGFALGLVSSSLTNNHKAAELGFMAIIAIEPIYECLALHKLLPDCQKEGWNDFWNTDNWHFVARIARGSAELKASVSLHNDGKQVYVGLYCRETSALDRGIQAIAEAVRGRLDQVTRSSAMHARLTFPGTLDEKAKFAHAAVDAARAAMAAFGFEESYSDGPSHD